MPEIAGRIWNTIPRMLLVPLACVCALGLLRAALAIPNLVPLDPNEGWNAYHALAAMAGKGLYPPPQSFMIDNYPPLSFYIVGALGHLTGDMILAGRAISLASFCLVMAGIAWLARLMRCSAAQAAFAALLFADAVLLTSNYVGMDDPQFLGHAIMLAGLIVILCRPEKTGALVTGALLMTVALFVKHNLIAVPLTVAIWLFPQTRRAGWRFILAGLGFGIAGLLVFRLAFGMLLWQVLFSSRIYTLANLTASLLAWLSWACLPIFVALLLLWCRGRDRHVGFCLLYALVAFLIGAGFSGGDGVDANALFDADIALCLCCALALSRFEGIRARAAITALAGMSLGFGLWQSASADAWQADYWLHPLRAETQMARQDIAFLKAHKGPALCETLAFCYWAGKAPQLDVFNVGEQYRSGARSDRALIGLLDTRGFAVIQFDSLSPFTLPPDVERALTAHYRIQHSNDDGVFLMPR